MTRPPAICLALTLFALVHGCVAPGAPEPEAKPPALASLAPDPDGPTSAVLSCVEPEPPRPAPRGRRQPPRVERCVE